MSAGKCILVCLVLAVLGQHALSAIVKDDLIFGLPGFNSKARTVRSLVHTANWTALATISTMSTMAGIPSIKLIAVADSPVGGDSTGNIYFYLQSSSSVTQDLSSMNNVSALFVNNDDFDCQSQDSSSLVNSCSQALITGSVTQLSIGSQTYTTGQSAVLSRHPASTNWVQNNNYFLCQLNVQNVMLFDSDGAHNISVTDYYNDKIFGIFNFDPKANM